MKKLLIIQLAIAAIFASQTISAQKVMNDPSYSTNNYKHPNKAAYMKKVQDEQPVIYLEEVKNEEAKEDNSLTSASNYKGMNTSDTKIKIYRIVNAPIIYPVVIPASTGNYKQQFAPRTKKAAKKTEEIKNISVVVLSEK